MYEPGQLFQPNSPKLEQVNRRLAWGGLISLWIQSALGVLASLSWLFVVFGRVFRLSRIYREGAGTTIAFWTVLLALLTLVASIYLTWSHQKLSRRLRADPAAAVVQVDRQLQLVLYASLVGIFLSIISSLAQVGEILGMTLFSRVGLQLEIPGLLLANASASITLAHFAGLASTLWIYGLLDRKTSPSS